MSKVISTHIVATAPGRASAPDSITTGAGSVWVEYGDGAPSNGGGTSTIVRYSMNGQVEQTYTAAGLADGLKYDPVTNQVWVLDNNDGNAALQLIDPTTGQISSFMSYAPPYVYGPASGRGFDDVAFDKGKVFMSETNPANPGDPIVVELLNGNAPFRTLQTSTIVSYGDMGTNMATGMLAPLPITDPDSLKTLPNGSLVLTGEADHSFVFINDPGQADQNASFYTLPAGDTPDDAIVPTATSGTFIIGNQGANDVVSVRVTGLDTNDLYANITSTGQLVQIDSKTGKVTTLLSGLDAPHGLAFVPDPVAAESPVAGSSGTSGAGPTARITGTHIVATAPMGDSLPDSITIGAGSLWVEYGNGAPSNGGGTSQIVRYSATGQVQHTYTVAGLADGLKYDPSTGNVWVLNNNDGNATLQFINAATNQVSAPLSYGAPYVYGADSGRGFDDVVFDKGKVFMSETNPANPGDPIVVQLTNGNAPFGTLHTSTLVSYGDMGTNMVTGQLAPLPVNDPDSLKLMPNGSLLLTSEADHSLTFINDPGTATQSTSFVTLPAGDTPDDAIMTNASSGTFVIANEGANDIVAAHATGLDPHDIYVDIYSQNELAQLDPTTGKVTPLLTGLSNPHGLAFIADAGTSSPAQTGAFSSIVPSASNLGTLSAALGGADQMVASSFTAAAAQPSAPAAGWTPEMSPGAVIGLVLASNQHDSSAVLPAISHLG